MISDFTAGAGFASSDGPASTVVGQPGDRAANSYIQLRGLSAPGMQRDAFMSLASYSNTGSTATGVTNNFDIERAEVIMGPQSLLYGNGGGGGVVNLVSKQARFGRRPYGSLRLQVDQYGGIMDTFDVGSGNNRLAVRAAFINQNAHSRRVNINTQLDGQYVQLAAKFFGHTVVRQQQNPSAPERISAENPNGVTLGGGNYNLVHIRNKGVYGINDTTWLDGRLNTLLGFRASHTLAETLSQGSAISAQNTQSGARKVSDEKAISYSVGANYAVRDWLRPYFAVSDSYNPPIATNNDPIGEQTKAAHAIGEEVGVKVQNASGTISGSLAIYHTSAKNETFFVTSTLAFQINPSGLNGRFGGAPSTIINVDRKASGAQLALNASPTRNLRFRLSAASITGKIGNTRTYQALYNDQFYANAAGQVTYKDGTVVFVNPTFTAASPTVPQGTANAIPLTIAALSTPGNSYYANPLPISGQINATSARSTLAVVDPVHGPILTGATGLPISRIQINPGFTPPSEIPVTKAGEGTTNYPAVSTNFTGVYTFTEGRLRGLRAGGTTTVAWYNRRYYYYPNGVAIGAERRLFSFPTQARFDLLLGYDRKFGRYTLGTQLNVSNLFNRYHIVITPNAITGWSGPNNAVFDAQPRMWAWSFTLGF